jgi:phage terminase small subunit
LTTMPPIESPRQERFAQELAKGRTQAEAYAAAGYRPSEQHASRLASSGKVAARVAEIQERAAVRAEITVASITQRLLDIATKGEAKDEAAMLAVARASLMDAAKLNGLVVDKSIAATTTLEDMLDSLEGATGEPTATAH